MKLIIRIFAAALLAGALTACTGSKTDNDDNGLTARQKIMLKSLEMEVAKVNKELPLDTGEGLTLTGMAIENGYLVSTCTYAEGSHLGHKPPQRAWHGPEIRLRRRGHRRHRLHNHYPRRDVAGYQKLPTPLHHNLIAQSNQSLFQRHNFISDDIKDNFCIYHVQYDLANLLPVSTDKWVHSFPKNRV